jgi:hypothetical protein
VEKATGRHVSFATEMKSLTTKKNCTCVRCGKPAYKKYCSMECRDRFRIEAATLPCPVCLKPFYRAPGHRKRGPCCSHACAAKNKSGEKSHLWRGGMVVKNCLECHKPFQVKMSESSRVDRCSHSCRGRLISRLLRHDLFDSCRTCKRTIKITKRKVGKRNFCNRACADVAHASLMEGQRNGRFVHGNSRNGYPREWDGTVQSTIRERDGYQCLLCGVTQEEHGRTLPVHHINYNKDDIRDGNLATVCRFCHGRMHGGAASRRAWQERFASLLSPSRSVTATSSSTT